MNSLITQWTVPLTAEDRAMIMLDAINCSDAIDYHTSMPGPVIHHKDGRDLEFYSWSEWDFLEEHGFIHVEDDKVGPTWAGIKALRAWERKRRR